MSSDEVHMPSESGSGIQTPEVEGIIKTLLSNTLDQAALGFQTTTPCQALSKAMQTLP
jgi:hypothetical protein